MVSFSGDRDKTHNFQIGIPKLFDFISFFFYIELEGVFSCSLEYWFFFPHAYQTLFLKLTVLYFYLIVTPMSVQSPMSSILTVTQLVSRHPLVSVLTSLCFYFRDFHWSFEIHLEPLMMIVVSCAPGPNVSTTFDCTQSSKSGCVVFVPY